PRFIAYLLGIESAESESLDLEALGIILIIGILLILINLHLLGILLGNLERLLHSSIRLLLGELALLGLLLLLLLRLLLIRTLLLVALLFILLIVVVVRTGRAAHDLEGGAEGLVLVEGLGRGVDGGHGDAHLVSSAPALLS